MHMVLSTEPELCTGCGSCVLGCSLAKEGRFGFVRSRIKLAKDEKKGMFTPIVCRQCASAPCATACPVDAINRSEGRILLVDEETCIGCLECAVACPFGVMAVSEGRPLKCDLCGGDPRCVHVCHSGALQFVREDRIGRARIQKILESSVGHRTSPEGE